MIEPVLETVDPSELGRRLQAARKARGLRQEDVAKRLGVARTTVTAIEAGNRRVRPGELVQLTALYGLSVNELVQRVEPGEPFSVQFRATLAPDAYEDADLEPHIFEFERLCEDYLHLEHLVGSPLPTRYPPPYPVDRARPEVSAEDVANQERQRLGLGDAPILNLREFLERDVGIRVFYIELPPKVAAMFAYTESLGGCIAVNRNHPPERRRHSLAHDFGHFLTDRFRAEIAVLGRYQRKPAHERFSEAFGRAFLLPGSGLRRRFNELYRAKKGQVTLADLSVLANYFFVSFEVLTRRLAELDLVPDGTWERVEGMGYRVREAHSLLALPEQPVTDKRLPTRYIYLAAEAYHSGKLTEGQLARFLRMDRVEARRAVQELGFAADLPAGMLEPDMSPRSDRPEHG